MPELACCVKEDEAPPQDGEEVLACILQPEGNEVEVDIPSKFCVTAVPKSVNEMDVVNVVAPALTELHALLPALLTAFIR